MILNDLGPIFSQYRPRARLERVFKLYDKLIFSHFQGKHNFKTSFTLKTHQTCSVHSTLEKFGNGTMVCHSGLVFEANSVREITCFS